MNTQIKPSIFAITLPALAALFSNVVQAGTADDCYYESQYGANNPVCGNYKSEISPARAFADTVATRGKWGEPSRQPVIIDVRSTPEYRAGHPEHAYNAPYPFIYQACKDWSPNKDQYGNVIPDGNPDNDRSPDGACILGGAKIAQPDADFAEYVKKLIPNKDTPIYTLCRTGHRSVGAAHILADAGYTNVRNIWEGFVGLYLPTTHFKLDANGNKIEVAKLDTPNVLFEDGKYYRTEPGFADLDHDGALTDNDKNGWRYHQELPYDTRLLPSLIYKDRADTYDMP